MRKGVDPIDLALAWYQRKGSVHFVIDYDGTIYQILDTAVRGAHIGVSRLERRRYLNGTWHKRLSHEGVVRWHKRWPGFKSPQHLYPGKSPNGAYIGVEVLPLSHMRVVTGGGHKGTWFTERQYSAVARLWIALWVQHGTWGCNALSPGPRLVGHEDVDAFGRWDPFGGWDPGAMRVRPRFDWNLVFE
jgi:N-acetyl-anhydromuramyl-L-alanine amidase AmpD